MKITKERIPCTQIMDETMDKFTDLELLGLYVFVMKKGGFSRFEVNEQFKISTERSKELWKKLCDMNIFY